MLPFRNFGDYSVFLRSHKIRANLAIIKSNLKANLVDASLKFRRLEPSKRHANQPHSRAAGGARYHLALFDLLWWQAKLESRSKSQICLTLYAFLLLFEIVAPSTLRLKFLMNLEKFSKLALSEKKRSFISFWLSFFKNLRE